MTTQDPVDDVYFKGSLCGYLRMLPEELCNVLPQFTDIDAAIVAISEHPKDWLTPDDLKKIEAQGKNKETAR